MEEALRVGYRMIDTAASHLNEREVGAAIEAQRDRALRAPDRSAEDDPGVRLRTQAD